MFAYFFKDGIKEEKSEKDSASKDGKLDKPDGKPAGKDGGKEKGAKDAKEKGKFLPFCRCILITRLIGVLYVISQL